MAFMHGVQKLDPFAKNDPILKSVGNSTYDALRKKTPPPAPGVPNPNDALNASQAQTDAMRMRRGMLANLYGGTTGQTPVTGSTALGT